MDYQPLVKEEIEAGHAFVRKFDKYAPVRAAFWLKEPERRYWHLYLASEEINDENFDRAYREVARLANEASDPNFDPFQVMVLGAEEPRAQAALDYLRRYPGRTPIHLRDVPFGGTFVEEVYLYPPVTEEGNAVATANSPGKNDT